MGLPILEFVRIGNVWYFLFIAFLIGFTVFSVWLCRKKGQTFSKRYISIMLWANFALHFLKQFLPGAIASWPYSLTGSLFPNLCAVLVFFGPFIFHFGNRYVKDYFYYIGILSGTLVYLVPTGALFEGPMGAAEWCETFRFYLCHIPLVVCPLLMVDRGFHKLDWKRLWDIPVIFGAVLLIISLQVVLFGPVLKIPGYPTDWVGPNGILNRLAPSNMHNQSMQFGPQPGVDKILGAAYPYLIPYLMTYKVDGQIYFTPVIWILPFIAIGTVIIGPLMTLPYGHADMKADIEALKARRRAKKSTKS